MRKVIDPRLYIIAKFRAAVLRNSIKKLNTSADPKQFDSQITAEYDRLLNNYDELSSTRKQEEWRFAKKWASENNIITRKQGSVWKSLPDDLSHLG
jgi:plasmid maintenance system killer protein